MRKKLSILFILLIVICCITLSGCDELSGASAYEIAIKNGFDGTELEWLESLKQGSSAYELAVTNGYTGTEQEWLASLNGTNGLDGADGADSLDIQEIYNAAKSNGFQGTFLDFLDHYLTFNTTSIENIAASKAILSVVSVHCTFTDSLFNEYYTAGSGVIYRLDNNGNAYIITNFHVVFDKNSIQNENVSQNIKLLLFGKENSDSFINATYIGGSMTYDIAVLKVSGDEVLKNSEALAVTLCPDNFVTVGQTAIAVGNPEAKGLSATSGIVSVDSEYINMTAADDRTMVDFRVMRVDTAINSGNSGGGLFNSSGELIGIVNAKIIDRSIENIGYAIPMSTAISVTDNIIANCANSTKTKMQRCLLGVTTIAESSSAFFDTDTSKTTIVETVKVYEIGATSIAKEKLLVGDILVSVNFRDKIHILDRSYVLVDIMLGAKVGETITISIMRNNLPMDISITLTQDCVVEVI